MIGTTSGLADAAPEAMEKEGDRGRVMLVLPRPDHVRGYAPLASALVECGLEAIVVSGAHDVAIGGGVQRVAAEFYDTAAGGGRWLRLVIRRELRARRLLRRMAVDVLVVPSDVADALVAFVAAARRRRVPVVYVQGVPVFPDFPRLNAETHAARSRVHRAVGALLERVLRLLGVHVATGAKAVLGSRADHVLAMDAEQARIHVAAGVAAERVRVTGAPFVDQLIALRRQFDDRARQRTLAAIGVDGPVALILTKSLHRLGWTSRATHDALISGMIDAVRTELPGWTCLVKLHPAESIEEYRALVAGADAAVRIVKEAPVDELLLAADVTVSVGTSGAALTARLLGAPLIVVTHEGIPMLAAHGDLAAGPTAVRSSAELRARLRALRSTRAGHSAAASGDGAGECADGRASARIAAILQTIVHAGRSRRP